MVYIVKIKGMFCTHCEEKICTEFYKIPGVKKVVVSKNTARLLTEQSLSLEQIVSTVKNAGYFTKKSFIKEKEENSLQFPEEINSIEKKSKISLKEFFVILLILFVLAMVLKNTCGLNVFNVIPEIDSSLSLSMIFVTGLFTGLHCLSMCGAFLLSSGKSFKFALCYNFGRLCSYSCFGFFAGLFGSVFKLNKIANGIFLFLSAVVMISMALKMLGIINFSFPFLKSSLFNGKKFSNSFLIGILNGFIPCGPLQAMQVYAISTGNAFSGALSMFLFCLGTFPVMLLSGVIFSVVRGNFKFMLNKISAVLILVLSVSMFLRVLTSFGFSFSQVDEENIICADFDGKIQTVRFNLDWGGYKDFKVKKGFPVRLLIYAEEEFLTLCNDELHSDSLGFSKKLCEGENEIIFTPEKKGKFVYSCWMDMLKNTVIVE